MLTGEAVTEKLVGGFTDADVKFFYEECIKASAEVIRSGKFSLYGENPASLDEAAQNYHKIFVEGKGISEVIFLRDYVYPGIAHNMGKWHEPNQLAVEYGGRCCPTLDLVESYAVIDPQTRMGTYDVKLVTTNDGNENYATNGFNPNVDYKQYDDFATIFANRDPRLYASVILPNTQWGGQTILIQGGLRKQDKSVVWQANDSYVFDGVTYYGKGDSDEGRYSGWVDNRANGTRSGFLLKKYLKGSGDQVWDQVVTPFVDLRYAEVLLNYAEAVAESNLPNAEGVITAQEALNKVHHRAGFLDNLALTSENVRRERKAEFALEYNTIWDYFRLREFHTIFDGTFRRRGLVPMLDFSGGEKKRAEVLQLELLKPKFAILDETDSGLDVDALRIVSEGVNRAKEANQFGILMVTHYTRILKYIKPDIVHVFAAGHFVKTGGPELADELEEFGYDAYLPEGADSESALA